MPTEFLHVVVVTVYTQPRAVPDTACHIISETVSRLQTQHPDDLFIISGDFNHVTLSSRLTGFSSMLGVLQNRIEYLSSSMPMSKRPTVIYIALPPGRKSDHNLVLLQP